LCQGNRVIVILLYIGKCVFDNAIGNTQVLLIYIVDCVKYLQTECIAVEYANLRLDAQLFFNLGVFFEYVTSRKL
jgi:hypothetical protein